MNPLELTLRSEDPTPRVMVAGCFDLLHPAHVLFLNKAAQFGKLYVSLGSDQSIITQKNKNPQFNELERKFMLESLSCVHCVKIATSPGPLGFREHLEEVKPHVFVINDDGHSSDKRELVESLGIEYRVFSRDHFDPATPTSTTQISESQRIPTRVSLCSGFIDNPVVNSCVSACEASLVVLPIEPIEDLQDRSGMATSTIRTVQKYFGCTLPKRYTLEQLGEIIFCLENPPHKRGYISGTLDSLGILGKGVNLFSYVPDTFFPARRDVLDDGPTLDWLEQYVYLKHSWQRPPGCEIAVDPDRPRFADCCQQLHESSLAAWDAIRRRDLPALAEAVNASREAQTDIVPNHCPPELAEFIRQEDAHGAMIMGAGGGGYVMFISERRPPDAIQVRIKREEL